MPGCSIQFPGPFFLRKLCQKCLCFGQGTFDHGKGQKSAISRNFPHWISFFANFSPVECCPFSQGFVCNLLRRSPRNVKNSPRFEGGKKCAVTSLAVMVFCSRGGKP